MSHARASEHPGPFSAFAAWLSSPLSFTPPHAARCYTGCWHVAAGADSDVVLLGRHSSIFGLGALHRPPRLVLVAEGLGLAVFVHGRLTQQGRVVEIHHLPCA